MATPTVPAGSGGEPAEIPQSIDSAADAAFAKALADQAQTETESPSVPDEPKTETQEAGSPPTTEAAPVTAPTPEDSPEWKNLLSKYGDKNAAAKQYWETNNRAAQLAKEKAELEEKLKAFEASPAAKPVATPEPSPAPAELQRVDVKIRATEEKYRNINGETQKYTQENTRLGQEIGKIVKQLASGDLSLDRDQLQAKLVDAYNEKAAVENYLDTLGERAELLNDKWQDLQSQREMYTRVLTQERELQAAREAKERDHEDIEVKSIRTQWDAIAEKVSKDAALIPASMAPRFLTRLKRETLAELASQEPITDYEKFARQVAADFMDPAKEFHQAQSATYAKQKAQDAATSAPTGAPALASETKRPRSEWTPQQWDKYHEEHPPF